MSADMLSAALRYARDGLEVFPLSPRRKTPLLSADDGGEGFHDATSDPRQITAWWTAHPSANIAIRPPAGTIVVDVDPRSGGDEQLDTLIARHGALPATWRARTGSHGLHLWFRLPEPGPVRAQLARGIDLKTHTTGYLVAPPSVHPNGERYRWLSAPAGIPALAPAWMVAAATPAPVPLPRFHQGTRSGRQGGRYSLQCLIARVERAPMHRRNIVFFGALKDAAADGNLEAYAEALGQAALTAGLTAREIAATTASVGRRCATAVSA